MPSQPTILPAPRRTCEECLAIRAPFSQPRKLPQPALPPAAPTPADELRPLLKDPLIRPVFVRCARQALESGDPARVASALISVRTELAFRQAAKDALHAAYPMFYPAA